MAIVSPANTYNYSNKVRAVNEIFQNLVAKTPTLASLVNFGLVTDNVKYEWTEDSSAPVSYTIVSVATNAITVASTANIQVGDIYQVQAATGASETEQVKVASIDSATVFTVTRNYGSTTTTTLATGQKLLLIATPLAEGTDAGTGAGFQPTVNYNYTQIFERMAQVSRTSQHARMYGIDSAIDYAVAKRLVEIAYDWNRSMIYGRKVARSASENGTMGGLLSFIEGGNVDTTGGAISETILSNLFEAVYLDGGQMGNFAILCAENQARKISAFNTSGTNPITQVIQGAGGENIAGRSVSMFRSDLPVGNFMANIVVDPHFPRDKVALINLDKVRGVEYLNSPLTATDATLPGADNFKQRILGELTLEVKDGQTAHAMATGLNV